MEFICGIWNKKNVIPFPIKPIGDWIKITGGKLLTKKTLLIHIRSSNFLICNFNNFILNIWSKFDTLVCMINLINRNINQIKNRGSHNLPLFKKCLSMKKYKNNFLKLLGK